MYSIKKIFFILDPDWPQNRWLGHLCNYHVYFVEQLARAGYRVISLSPDPEKAQKLLEDYFSIDLNKISFVSYAELKEKTTESAATEMTVSTEISNRNFYYHKILEKVPINNDAEISSEISNDVKRTRIEFSKFNRYINFLISQYEFKASDICVLFPYVDTYVYYEFTEESIDTFFTFPWYGMFIQTKLNQDAVGLDEFNLTTLSFFNCQNCQGIGVLEEDKVEKLQRTFPLKIISLFPDIITETRINNNYLLAQHIRAAANNRKIIGLLGRLNEDKGIINFLRASIHALNNNQDYFFVLIGGGLFQSQEFVTLLNEASENENNITYLHSITTDEDFNSVFVECDIIYAAYRNFHFSSNTLAKAALYDKPIIVSTGFLMHERVEKYQIGIAIDQDNPTEALLAIECLLKKQDLYGAPLNFEFEKFRNDHSYKRFGLALRALIQESQNVYTCNSLSKASWLK